MRSAPSPPTSDVTFLFTDIEGSTALWDRVPKAMTESLAEHDRRINSIVDAHNVGPGEKTAPASRSFCTMNESCAGVVPSSAKHPAAVVIASHVSMLSLMTIGMPWSGAAGAADRAFRVEAMIHGGPAQINKG